MKEPIKFQNMKLRKSLVNPVTWQNISSCLVLPPEIVMHDALRARCTDLTKWLTRELTIWLSVDALHETLTLG